jgi:hypothetical protein
VPGQAGFLPVSSGTVLGGGGAMRIDGKNIRIRSPFEIGHQVSAYLVIILGFFALALTTCAQPQIGPSAAHGSLSTEEIVQKLVAMNLRRSEAFHSYHGTRKYRVEYRSFLSTLSAEMLVEVQYLAPETKHFTIRSSTGSKLIIDKVFKKLLEAEEDALSKDGQRSTALNGENYDFKLVDYVRSPSRSMYILAVTPKTKSKFLFRGRVWVDADDFAVVRLEAEPAKNPSFWTKNSEIEQLYMKVNDFWLPERNHSISSIRLGGRAELTIDYQNYQITASDPVGNLTSTDVAGFTNTGFTPDARRHLLTSPQKQGP